MLTESKKKEKILELENRRKIYEIVRQFSGCHFREIERKSRISHGTLKYHLNFLIKHQLIIGEKENNHLRYFPKNFQPENIKLLSLLRQKSIRKIILFLVINENSSHNSITRFVILSPSTISWHLNKLVKAGILISEKSGRKAKYKLVADKDEIIKLLVAYKESFLDSLVDRVVEMWDIK